MYIHFAHRIYVLVLIFKVPLCILVGFCSLVSSHKISIHNHKLTNIRILISVLLVLFTF